MRPHVIPQQFNQTDRIGKFTMPQFVILAAFTCLFVLVVISSNFWVSLAAFFPLAIMAFILMYFKVNKIPIYEFIMIYAIYIGSPKLLIYRSDNLKSIEEKEEGIGFIDVEKKNLPKKDASKKVGSGSKKEIQNQKNAPKGPNKQRKQQPKPNNKNAVKNVTNKKKGVR